MGEGKSLQTSRLSVSSAQRRFMAFKIFSFPGCCFQKPNLPYQMCYTFQGERSKHKKEEGKSPFLRMRRTKWRETLGLGRGGAPPWQCPGARSRERVGSLECSQQAAEEGPGSEGNSLRRAPQWGLKFNSPLTAGLQAQNEHHLDLNFHSKLGLWTEIHTHN